VSLLASRAERIKLATTLVVQPDEIAYLDQIPALQVHRVRTAVLEWVFDQERPTFQRFAAALKWLPSSLLALLAARYFPALPLARVAGELPAHKAMAVAVRLPPALIADVCTHLDPRRAPDLVRLIPAPVIVAIALELVERRDYITMSQFVDFLADDTIEAVIQAIDDETHLVHIAYFVESKNRLDHLVRMMPRERLRRAILLVLDESQAIMLEVISLIVHVSYALKRELGELAAAQDEHAAKGGQFTIAQGGPRGFAKHPGGGQSPWLMADGAAADRDAGQCHARCGGSVWCRVAVCGQGARGGRCVDR